jgi:mannosyltransferase
MQVQNSKPTGKSVRALFLQPWLPIVLILLLATVLRLYQLGTESLWVDEFHSLRAVEDLRFNFRVLYFALLRVWMTFGMSDAWLRGLSVIFGVGSVFLIYQLGYHLVGRATGLISAFVIAVSPLFIFHSQEVRMYMLSTFLTMAGTLALVIIFNRPSITLFCTWLVARVLAIYTTPINLLLILPDIILIFFNFRKQRRIFITALGGISILGILFLPVAFRFVNASKAFLSRADTLPTTSAAEILGQLPAATVYWPMRQLPNNLMWLYGLWGLVLLFSLGFLIFNKGRSNRLNWLAAWAFLPPGILLIVSSTIGDIWTPRYLLLSTPYFIILFAAGFVRIWKWNRIVAFGITIIYALTLSLGIFHYYSEIKVTNWRGAVQTISAQEQEGDRILVSSDFMKNIVFDHYYSGSIPVEVVESLKFFRHVKQEELAEDLRQLSSNSSRLWILYIRPQSVDENGQQHQQVLQAAIDTQFEVRQHKVFSGYLDTLDLFLLIPQVNAQKLE